MSQLDPSVARLGRLASASWSLTLYPEAREAGGTFVPARPPSRAGRGPGPARDPERARTEAARRAKGRLRRYCATNRLNRLGTLTYRGEGCHDSRIVRGHVGEFFRELRTSLDGSPFPYAWVPEWHKSGHGLHLHFAVGQFIPRGKIEKAWAHGFISIKLLGDLPVGSGTLAQARRAAGYLSKYVTKSFGDHGRPAGLHRFDVAQGFQPQVTRLSGRSAHDVISQASELLGASPVRRWSSADADNWPGAPAVWAQWA